MGAIIAEAPAAPVPLAEVKAFLRIATSEEDALLAAMVRAAAETCEAFTGRALLVRAVEEMLPASRAWTRLGLAPVAAIEAVALVGADGAVSALAASDYAIDIDAAGEGWVRLTIGLEPKRVRVSYRAGLAADANGLPEALRHGIVRLAAYLYASRDRPDGPPAAVTALWRPWRRLRLV
jgi:uncharacterized phiE125 gp8 family phage protein